MALRAPVRRLLAFLVGDVVLLSFALVGAFLLRFEGEIPEVYHSRLAAFILLSILVKTPVFYFFGLYRMSWTYASLQELINVVKATTIGALFFGAILFIALREQSLGTGVPRSVLIIDFALTLLLVGGLRSAKRVYTWLTRRSNGSEHRLLIVGAGAAGETLLRELRRNETLKIQVAGLVDDDPAKIGSVMHGVRVLGRRQDIPHLVESEGVDEIIIAMPSVPVKTIGEIASICKRTKVPVKILPAIYASLFGRVLGHIREIQIEDLLPRRPVRIEVGAVVPLIRGESVLVTGAGGSIGSELCRQIAQLEPRRLVLLGHAENDVFEIESELRQTDTPAEIVTVIADVRNEKKIGHVFETYGPTIVFHAAAHKHVPLMETNPDEAVLNNIVGTKIVADASDRHGVSRMVFVSTDKAVNPTSIMGASKRWAELLVQALAQKRQTKFMIVRFGNVLNSTGSVVPIFRKQIVRGGPVTVTDPAMTRYFMTIPEAVHLIIQACAMGEGGEVFVLDMGEPVRIIDLAENLVRLSGLEPYRDIEIKVVGARAGEKAHEETFFADEVTERTRHDHIFVAKVGRVPEHATIESEVAELVRLAEAFDSEGMRQKLRRVTVRAAQ